MDCDFDFAKHCSKKHSPFPSLPEKFSFSHSSKVHTRMINDRNPKQYSQSKEWQVRYQFSLGDRSMEDKI